MRIAHVTATFPPQYSGTGTVCYHNALGLARLGHEVTVFTAAPAAGGEGHDPPGVTVRRLPTLLRFGNAPLLPGLLWLNGFDLVHLHYPFYFGAELLWLKSLTRGLPYIVTYHQDVLFAGALGTMARWHHRLLGTRILRRACRVLATSWDYAHASRLAGLLDTDPQRVSELPNGVDTDRFHPKVDGDSVRQTHGLRHTDHIVLFVGALDRAHHFKGIEVLLLAMAQLRSETVHLWVVGEGDLRESYQRRAHQSGLAERVVFCGRVSERELAERYAACDVLVLPSTTIGEAFGVVLLEAMASGKPVIASDLPGVRAVVSDGQDGLLVRRGDASNLAQAIGRLLDDSRLRRQMGQQGRCKVEAQYAWPRIIPRLVEFYEEVLAEAAGV
jgi:glycosyltransferase involved in cell wall biosynthesis